MLLERERELDALDGALAAACDGEGSFVLVEGEIGVGRSSLLLAAEDRAFDRDMTTLVARGSELERDLPFGAVVQLLERLVCALPGDDRDLLFEGPSRLAMPLFPTLRRAGEQAAEDPLALVHGAYWLIARVAELRPLVICIDDVQWIDERSLQVLRYLAARVADLPVALLVAATAVPEPLVAAAPPRRLVLGPLTAEGVARRVLADFPDADAVFCAACSEATSGLPLLLDELLAAVRNHDLAPSADTAPGLARLGLPEVAEAALARLDALPPGTRPLARTAAVLGDDAELHHTAELAGVDVQTAATALDALCATGIIDPDETVRFRHPMVRAALEASVAPPDRERLHLQAAQLLLGDAAPPERVAGHLMAGERGGRRWVVETLRRAARRAMSDGAPASAARYLGRALAEPPAPETEPEVLLELARAEAAAGSPDAPARIRAALEPVVDADERTRALAQLIQAPVAGDGPVVVDAFADGLRLAHERGADPEATCWIEATLLAAARDEPELRRRAGRLHGLAGTADATTPAGRALLAQRAVEAALAGAGAREVRDMAEQALGRGTLVAEDRPGGPHVAAAVRALSFADDLQSAELVVAMAIERARERASPEAYARMSALRADVSLRRGSLSDAVADARAALEAGAGAARETATAAYAMALCEHGDLEGAARVLAEVDIAKVTAAGAATLLCARAHVHLAAGALAEATVAGTTAGEHAAELGADAPAWLAWRTPVALALTRLAPDEARRVAHEQLELARGCRAGRAVGSALRVAGVAEGGERGVALLAESVSVLRRSHAALERAHAQGALGAALRVARQPLAAREPLREALAAARRSGALLLERRIHGELAAAGERVHRPTPDDAATLTAVERRIVDLATDGLDAEEIADAQFLTVKAVEWHLRSASRKLGAGSPAQLLASMGARH